LGGVLACGLWRADLIAQVRGRNANMDAVGHQSDAQIASERASFTVDIRDFALVPRFDITKALAQVNAIFDSAGIRPVFRIERVSKSGTWSNRPLPGKVITVHIYPQLMDDRVVADSEVLGAVPGAASGGRLAYVFSSRVAVIAKRNASDYGTLLGTVLAHEIGHVLLSGEPHSRVGLMQPLCDGKQILGAALGTPTFTPAQTADIKNRLF
jgi:hypothetical protein